MKILCTELAEEETEWLLVDTRVEPGWVFSQASWWQQNICAGGSSKMKIRTGDGECLEIQLIPQKAGLKVDIQAGQHFETKYSYGEGEFEYLGLGERWKSKAERQTPNRIWGRKTYYLLYLVVSLFCLLMCCLLGWWLVTIIALSIRFLFHFPLGNLHTCTWKIMS